MRARSVVLGATLALVSLAVALAVTRGGAPDGTTPTARETPGAVSAPTVVPSPPPLALGGLRDIFRFADDRAGLASGRPRLAEDSPPPPITVAPVLGPRLVGLVRRSGRLVAALALEGEVVLAGPGESAFGVTVVSVDDDAVHVRRRDGSESALVLP